MRYSIVASALAAASTAAAQNFRIVVNYGGLNQVRTWYGDGHLYVGAIVPESVEKALNFTIPNYSATLPQVVVGPVPPATEEDLAPGTFLAVNNATGATDPVVLLPPSTELPEGYVDDWVRYGLTLLPRGVAGTPWPGYFLEPTDTTGTFRVTWRTPGEGNQGDGGLTAVRLEAIL